MKKYFVFVLAFVLMLGCALTASAEDTRVFTLSAPSGAPALAVAAMAVDNPEAYTFVAADTIAAEFAGNNADFIIAPLNAGAKLYKAGKSTYKLGAVVTWGNLFIASQKADFKLEDINGAEITLFGEDTINASIVLFALEKNGLTPANVSYLAGAANTQSLLLTDENAIVVTAEPALTAAKIKNENITSYSVNDLYKNVTGYDGYTQAALFIKAETLAEDPEGVAAFLEQAAEAAEKCTSDLAAVADAAVALEILPNPKVAMSAIPNCAIRFVPALEAKEQIETTANVDLTQFGGAVPADDFYYGAE